VSRRYDFIPADHPEYAKMRVETSRVHRDFIPASETAAAAPKNVVSERPEHICGVCGKVCKNPQALRMHARKHKTEKPSIASDPSIEEVLQNDVNGNLIPDDEE
jgi:hypothetical protein